MTNKKSTASMVTGPICLKSPNIIILAPPNGLSLSSRTFCRSLCITKNSLFETEEISSIMRTSTCVHRARAASDSTLDFLSLAFMPNAE